MSHARKQARQALVQALYQWQIAQQNIHEIEVQFREEKQKSKMDFNYFSELLHQIPAHLNELDNAIEPCVERRMEEVNPIELAILRLGAYELKHRMDIPFRVVINEGVDLCKKFGAEQGHKFINKVLDKLAHQFRQLEVNAAKR